MCWCDLFARLIADVDSIICFLFVFLSVESERDAALEEANAIAKEFEEVGLHAHTHTPRRAH